MKSIHSFLGILLAFAPSFAHAQASAVISKPGNRSFQVSKLYPDDSHVILFGTSAPQDKFLEVWFYFNGERSYYLHQTFDVMDSQFSRDLILGRGPGKYLIKVGLSPQKKLYFNVGSVQVENSDSPESQFLFPTPLMESNDPLIQKLAHSITDSFTSPREKSRAIHDWVASHIQYDVKDLGSTSVAPGQFDPYRSTARTVLDSKLAFCNGYAELTAALHRAIGIPARMIHGMANLSVNSQAQYTGFGPSEKAEMSRDLLAFSESHPKYEHHWNEVYLPTEAGMSNEWVSMDTTFDSGSVVHGKFYPSLSHLYFNPGPDSDFWITHIKIEIDSEFP